MSSLECTVSILCPAAAWPSRSLCHVPHWCRSLEPGDTGMSILTQAPNHPPGFVAVQALPVPASPSGWEARFPCSSGSPCTRTAHHCLQVRPSCAVPEDWCCSLGLLSPVSSVCDLCSLTACVCFLVPPLWELPKAEVGSGSFQRPLSCPFL